jgi:hypothetical protein
MWAADGVPTVRHPLHSLSTLLELANRQGRRMGAKRIVAGRLRDRSTNADELMCALRRWPIHMPRTSCPSTHARRTSRECAFGREHGGDVLYPHEVMGSRQPVGYSPDNFGGAVDSAIARSSLTKRLQVYYAQMGEPLPTHHAQSHASRTARATSSSTRSRSDLQRTHDP